jgi:hypothetical protein
MWLNWFMSTCAYGFTTSSMCVSCLLMQQGVIRFIFSSNTERCVLFFHHRDLKSRGKKKFSFSSCSLCIVLVVMKQTAVGNDNFFKYDILYICSTNEDKRNCQWYSSNRKIDLQHRQWPVTGSVYECIRVRQMNCVDRHIHVYE